MHSAVHNNEIMTEDQKVEIRKMIREILGADDSEQMAKQDEIITHLAETMDIIALRHLAVKEAASLIQCYAMGDTEGMLQEYYELKIAMHAVMKHLPDILPEMQKKKAIDKYERMFLEK
jgi:hypothetical protein